MDSMKEEEFFLSARGRRASKCTPLDLQTVANFQRKHANVKSEHKDTPDSEQSPPDLDLISIHIDTVDPEEKSPADPDGPSAETPDHPEAKPSSGDRSHMLKRDASSVSEHKLKRFRRKIVRQLLTNFDLEATLRHYRALYATAYDINPLDYSYDW